MHRAAPANILALLVTLSGCSHRPADQPASSDSAPAATQRLGFAITSPSIGDTLVEGRSYVIRWMAPDTFRINLGAEMGGKDKGMLLNDVPAIPDSLVWTVPIGFVTGFGPTSSDDIRLRLENVADPDQWTEAGPFTITGTQAH
jgi:hypothetical protein